MSTLSNLVDDIKKLEELASKQSIKEVIVIKEVPVEPKRIMTVIGPSRRSIVIYGGQPLPNQRKIVKLFMEVENAREAIRARIQSERARLD